MEELLPGRVVLVTGASSGIGRATAILLAREGASVVAADTRSEPREGGPTTVDVIRAAGGRAVYVHCDVTDAGDRRTAVAEAEALGGLDVLVNNAGIFRVQTFVEVTEAEYDAMADVNLKAAFFMAQEAARVMSPRRRGAIINVSSMGGLRGAGNFVAYSATKFGVRGLTLALAEELGPVNVRVNAVFPGVIATAMTSVDLPVVGTEAGNEYLETTIPLRRAGEPTDVAKSILFLASDHAGYVSGASLAVDGGYFRS